MHLLIRAARGAVAGTVATVPMTVLMELIHRRLPPPERYPLPPRQIVEELADKTEAPLPADEDERTLLTLAAHFGYGAGAGAVYAALDGPRPLATGTGRGVLFGLGVWAASYVGWLPAFHVLRPATEHPVRRTLLMVGAHVVWGAAAGAIASLLQHSEDDHEAGNREDESGVASRLQAFATSARGRAAG